MMQPLKNDLCLVATSEAAMIAALSTKTTNEETGETQSNNVFHDGKNWVGATHDWQLVPIGPLQITIPEMNAEGRLTTPAEFDDRFHMNILCNDTVFAALQAFDQAHFETTGERLIIEPTNRKVVWAK
tara:strand:+ start:59705 stop:60088 length:384 start_codon:yes stop_codon:yes gene_type:complete